MRIASLVPSATELLFALGLGDSVVGVTHECDYPPQAAEIRHLTASVIDHSASSAAEIDAAVRERTEAGEALYELDEDALADLAPDLIVTQAVCEVCAVGYDDVVATAARLPSRPQVLSLDPSTLGEVLNDIIRLGEATDAATAAADLHALAAARIDAVVESVKGIRPLGVIALEWLDPVYIGGHWVPQMIELAGGLDLLGHPGERSRTASWQEIVEAAASAHVIVAMPCGYATDSAAAHAAEHSDQLAPLGTRVVAVDASSYFSRPGPRLVDGIELLGHLLHPSRVPPPPDGRFRWLDPDRSAA